DARRLFALRVPRAFIARMEKGNPDDPLLRQVLTSRDEFIVAPVFFGFYAIVLSSGDNHFLSRHNDLQPIVYDFKICLLITYVS
ncbi:hypothetical protein MJM59_33095, partial [Salmonella enterica subsp. enterica serovar Montevideo]|nr:hypothetical protein [Salmonella enterica subsp. enterica serovar Montevideo]